MRRWFVFLCLTLLMTLPTGPATGVPNSPAAPTGSAGVQLSITQTGADPGDYLLALAGNAATAVYAKSAAGGLSGTGANAAVIVLPNASSGPTHAGNSAGHRRRLAGPGDLGGLAWTGQAVLATVFFGITFAALGALLLLLARRRRTAGEEQPATV